MRRIFLSGPYSESRYTDKFIAENYEDVCMVGKKGGGFIFDTNSIHKGEVKGTRERTVVILEVNKGGKTAEMIKVKGKRPCPSPGQHMIKIPVKTGPLAKAARNFGKR